MNAESSTPPPAPLSRWLPWFLAAGGALGMLFLGLQTATARREAEALRLQLELRELELREARNRSAAERLILERELHTARPLADGPPPGGPAQK